MAEAKLQIIIDAADHTGGAMKSAIDGLENLSKQAQAVGIALSAIGAGGILLTKSFVAAGIEQQNAMRALSIVVSNTGASFEDYRQTVLETTAALQRKTSFGDEEQIRVLATLTAATGSIDVALAALPSVLNVATVAQMDLNSAARTLAGALSGQTNTIRGTGLAFKESQGPIERLIMLQERLGGAAEANADPLMQMGNALGDLKETIGVALLPMIVAFTVKVTVIAGKIGQWIEENQALVSGLAKAGLALIAFAAVVGPILLSLTLLSVTINTVSKAVMLLRIAIILLARHPLVLLATAIAFAILQFTGLLEKIKEFIIGTKEMTGGTNKVGAQITKLNQELEKLEVEQIQVEESARTLAEAYGSTLSSALQETGAGFGNIRKAMTAVAAVRVYETISNATSGLTQAIGGLTAEQRKMFKVIQDIGEPTVSKFLKTLSGFNKLGLGLSQSIMVALVHTTDELEREIADLASSVSGGTQMLEQMQRAGIGLADQFAVLRARIEEISRGNQPDFVAMEVAIKEVEVAIKEVTATAQELPPALFQVMEGVQLLGDTMIFTTEDAFTRYVAGLERMQEEMRATEEADNRLWEELGRKRVSGTEGMQPSFGPTLLGGFLENVQGLGLSIEQLNELWATAMQSQAMGPVLPLALQHGGIVRRPTLALLGESGPEAVIPLRRGGMAPQVNINLSGSTFYGFEDFERRINDAIQSIRRRGGLQFLTTG